MGFFRELSGCFKERQESDLKSASYVNFYPYLCTAFRNKHPSDWRCIMNNKFDFTGYRKHPRLNLWGHEGCAYFVNAHGHKLAHQYGPAMRAKSKGRGYRGPTIQSGSVQNSCHVLMGEIFYGERDVYIDSKGKPYFGICHHLIEDPLDYSPENLLCWLTYSEHRKADDRRRALEAVVPDGDLHVFSYARLRELQDPRTMTDDQFQKELEKIRDKDYHRGEPLDCGAEPNKYADPFIERE